MRKTANSTTRAITRRRFQVSSGSSGSAALTADLRAFLPNSVGDVVCSHFRNAVRSGSENGSNLAEYVLASELKHAKDKLWTLRFTGKTRQFRRASRGVAGLLRCYDAACNAD